MRRVLGNVSFSFVKSFGIGLWQLVVEIEISFLFGLVAAYLIGVYLRKTFCRATLPSSKEERLFSFSQQVGLWHMGTPKCSPVQWYRLDWTTCRYLKLGGWAFFVFSISADVCNREVGTALCAIQSSTM